MIKALMILITVLWATGSLLLWGVAAPIYAAECTYLGEQCVEGPGTRTIDGIQVTRQCWKYQVQYGCYARENAIEEEPACQELRNRGCGQVSSRCIATEPTTGLCIRYEQGYSCPDAGVTRSTVDCGSQTLCQGGNCASTAYQPNQGFGQSAALVEALGEVSRELEKDRFTIFTGKPERCTIDLVGFRNCCKVSGWGYDAGLADCSFNEKQLAQNRGAGRCHYIGTYCSKRVRVLFASWCVRDTQSHCCYGSKLARIIAEQARIQLGRGWGSAQNPDCSGFSVEQEIARLDFSAMDLSEFYQDVLNKTPGLDPARTKSRIQQSLQRSAGQ